jgi:hypothetical protein
MPLRTAATTTALRRIVHLPVGGGRSIIWSKPVNHLRWAFRAVCSPFGCDVALGREHTTDCTPHDTDGSEERGNRCVVLI